MSYSNRSADILDYIANLNRIPSESDSTSSGIDQYPMENNLAMFSNTQYFDFDLGHDIDIQQSGFTPAADPNLSVHEKIIDFSFHKFGSFPKIFDQQDTSHETIDTSINTAVDSYSASASPSGCIDSFGTKGKVHCATSPSSCTELNDISRHSAEEDKRRRNTAASARFRIKKKQREQALEKSAKEMSDKVAKLESHIKMLETENKWLKDLLTDKNENRGLALSSSWKQHKQEGILEQEKDGVGTDFKS